MLKRDDNCIDIVANYIKGKDGRDGRDGKDGRDGRDGIDGKDGKDGKDGTGITEEEKQQIAEKIKASGTVETWENIPTEVLVENKTRLFIKDNKTNTDGNGMLYYKPYTQPLTKAVKIEAGNVIFMDEQDMDPYRNKNLKEVINDIGKGGIVIEKNKEIPSSNTDGQVTILDDEGEGKPDLMYFTKVGPDDRVTHDTVDNVVENIYRRKTDGNFETLDTILKKIENNQAITLTNIANIKKQMNNARNINRTIVYVDDVTKFKEEEYVLCVNDEYVCHDLTPYYEDGEIKYLYTDSYIPENGDIMSVGTLDFDTLTFDYHYKQEIEENTNVSSNDLIFEFVTNTVYGNIKAAMFYSKEDLQYLDLIDLDLKIIDVMKNNKEITVYDKFREKITCPDGFIYSFQFGENESVFMGYLNSKGNRVSNYFRNI